MKYSLWIPCWLKSNLDCLEWGCNPSFSATTHWVIIGGEPLHCVGKSCQTLLVSSHYVMFVWVRKKTMVGHGDTESRLNVPETQDLSSKMSYITKGALGLKVLNSKKPIQWFTFHCMASIDSSARHHHWYRSHQDYGAKAVPETEEKQLSIVPHYRNGRIGGLEDENGWRFRAMKWGEFACF